MEINKEERENNDIKIIDIKNTEEFKKNLDMIMNQTVIDKDKASILLEKNNNDIFNTLIEILDEKKCDNTKKQLHSFEPKTEEDHKNNKLELRNIMKEKDKMFNNLNKK